MTKLGAEHIVKVDARTWEKKRKTMNTPRTFFIAADTHADADNFLMWTQSNINFLAEQGDGPAAAMGAAGRRGTSAAADSRPMSFRRPMSSSLGSEGPSTLRRPSAGSVLSDGGASAMSDSSDSLTLGAGAAAAAALSASGGAGGASPTADGSPMLGCSTPASAAVDEAAEVARLAAMLSPSQSSAAVSGNKLVVVVEEAQRLQSSKQAGAPNLFVTVHLEDASVTSPNSWGSLDPVWGAPLAFPVTVRQASDGLLVVRLWDRDREGVDQCVGVAEVPLKTVAVSLGAPPPKSPVAAGAGAAASFFGVDDVVGTAASPTHARASDDESAALAATLPITVRLEKRAATSPLTGLTVSQQGGGRGSRSGSTVSPTAGEVTPSRRSSDISQEHGVVILRPRLFLYPAAAKDVYSRRATLPGALQPTPAELAAAGGGPCDDALGIASDSEGATPVHSRRNSVALASDDFSWLTEHLEQTEAATSQALSPPPDSPAPPTRAPRTSRVGSAVIGLTSPLTALTGAVEDSTAAAVAPTGSGGHPRRASGVPRHPPQDRSPSVIVDGGPVGSGGKVLTPTSSASALTKSRSVRAMAGGGAVMFSPLQAGALHGEGSAFSFAAEETLGSGRGPRMSLLRAGSALLSSTTRRPSAVGVPLMPLNVAAATAAAHDRRGSVALALMSARRPSLPGEGGFMPPGTPGILAPSSAVSSLPSSAMPSPMLMPVAGMSGVGGGGGGGTLNAAIDTLESLLSFLAVPGGAPASDLVSDDGFSDGGTLEAKHAHGEESAAQLRSGSAPMARASSARTFLPPGSGGHTKPPMLRTASLGSGLPKPTHAARPAGSRAIGVEPGEASAGAAAGGYADASEDGDESEDDTDDDGVVGAAVDGDLEGGSPRAARRRGRQRKANGGEGEGEVRMSASKLGEVCQTLAGVVAALRHSITAAGVGSRRDSLMGGDAENEATQLVMAAMKAMDVDETSKQWLTREYMRPAAVRSGGEEGSAGAPSGSGSPGEDSDQPTTLNPSPRRRSKAPLSPGGMNGSSPPKPTPSPATSPPAAATTAPSGHGNGSGGAAGSGSGSAAAAASVWASVADGRTTLPHSQRVLTVVGDLVAGPGTDDASDGWLGWGLYHLAGLTLEPGEGELANNAGDDPVLVDSALLHVPVTTAALAHAQRTRDIFDRIYYEDAEDAMHGPFPARQIAEWAAGGDLPPEAGMRVGAPGEDTVELDSIVPQLRLRSMLARGVEMAAQAGGLDSWSFDLWKVRVEAPAELVPLPLLIMARLRLPRFFPLSELSAIRFTEEVAARMSLHGDATPYHNFYHAVDVMQTVNALLVSMQAARLFTPIETLALVLGGFCHDLEHPGVNNAFLINTSHELALRYNDASVLENHHAATAFQIMHATGLVASLPKPQYKEMRRIMVAGILATDMSFHFALTEEFKAVGLVNGDRIRHMLSAARGPGFASYSPLDVPPPGGDHGGATSASSPGDAHTLLSPEEEAAMDLSPADRLVILKNCLHAADISNPTRAYSVSKIWSDRVLQEFFAQVRPWTAAPPPPSLCLRCTPSLLAPLSTARRATVSARRGFQSHPTWTAPPHGRRRCPSTSSTLSWRPFSSPSPPCCHVPRRCWRR